MISSLPSFLAMHDEKINKSKYEFLFVETVLQKKKKKQNHYIKLMIIMNKKKQEEEKEANREKLCWEMIVESIEWNVHTHKHTNDYVLVLIEVSDAQN